MGNKGLKLMGSRRRLACVLSAWSMVGLAGLASAAPNSWKNASNDFWEVSSNWSLNAAPASSQTALLITNAVSKFVSADNDTADTFPNTLTVSNLTVSAPVGSTNTLDLFAVDGGVSPTPLRLINSLTIGPRGVAWVDDSTLQVDGLSGGGFSVDGSVSLFTGSAKVIATTATTRIGDNSTGLMTVSAGTVLARDVIIGNNVGSGGTLSVGGGKVTVGTNLRLGDYACSAVGNADVVGGSLFVTNATLTAVADVRSGTLKLTSGTLKIDRLVMTNACGHIAWTGGLLMVGASALAAAFDADSDGLPNGWEQANRLDPLSALGDNGAAGDPDRDGLTNAQELAAGSDPTGIRVVSFGRVGNDMRIGWEGYGGNSYFVQTTSGTASGGYNTNFTTLTTIVMPGSGASVTNYLDSNGATNSPARYYRVRLAP